MIWDTTPQALREWREGRSAQYEDPANASLENPMGALLWGMLSDGLEKGNIENGDSGERRAVDEYACP